MGRLSAWSPELPCYMVDMQRISTGHPSQPSWVLAHLSSWYWSGDFLYLYISAIHLRHRNCWACGRLDSKTKKKGENVLNLLVVCMSAESLHKQLWKYGQHRTQKWDRNPQQASRMKGGLFTSDFSLVFFGLCWPGITSIAVAMIFYSYPGMAMVFMAAVEYLASPFHSAIWICLLVSTLSGSNLTITTHLQL